MTMQLVRIKFGSHLYGTATPESDLDYKGVHVPAARDILLQRAAPVLGAKVKAREGVRNAPGDVDDESYALHRYLQLLAEGQTVAIDMLFAPEWACVGVVHPLWRHIQLNAERLVTRKSAAFVGYCRTQANKYGIKGSRVAAAKRAMDFFVERLEALGPQARIVEVAAQLPPLCVDEHTKLVEQPRKTSGQLVLELDTEVFFECCNRKVSYGNTIKAAWEMYKRVYDEYGARARLADTNEGVDWKALSHAVRVGQEALELLGTGRVTFPIKNAGFLLDIKKGLLPYSAVAHEIEHLLDQVEAASKVSTLREEPDQGFIELLVERAYAEAVRKECKA
jgi:hypothetical protein